ncbi:hypothetical protein GQ600_17432 [Phytophthora cactorum]|nr:hypothetical protein GQ600_17432 [Phytophthora cactorum]
MGAFFYFVQPQLWKDIAEASNEYFMEKVDERVTGQYEKQLARERKQPGYREKHSRRNQDLSTGNIGHYISSNSDPRAASDRAWKLRPVINALQEIFKAWYKPPPVMAFDEAMLSFRLSFDRMRVYTKENPTSGH